MMQNSSINPLPLVLAGPILRRCTPNEIVFWFATSSPVDLGLQSDYGQHNSLKFVKKDELRQTSWQVGERAFILGLIWSPATPLKQVSPIHYDVIFNTQEQSYHLNDVVDAIVYSGHQYPHFVIDLNITEVVHGSCRKPHHCSEDALVRLDEELEKRIQQDKPRPNYLMMSGDQVYVDDVAGPMLHAIHQVIEKCGLVEEPLTDANIHHSRDLASHHQSFYQRDQLLPISEDNQDLKQQFWRGKRKPIFTSVNGGNHLISFSEVMAMYLLTWSPTLWSEVTLEKDDIIDEFCERYATELHAIKGFISGLSQVRRLMAHLPSYMIFDDHDVTDDWNLTREWEEASYNNAFSKRIIGNALLAYLLCQGWGNAPKKFALLEHSLANCFDGKTTLEHDDLIDELFAWHQWGYELATSPATIVLDTRTQRWRSESNARKPSGLMDWESLSYLQQQLIDKDAVILVSPAPIYGVKLIEAIQKIMTFFGLALTVDAENWMAHKGTANVILNIFRHKKTPPLFIILSGDVHYSFVYDVSLKFSNTQPHICQITASGIKNTFPETLLLLFDKLNRWLFHAYSPLNWLTRRRNMTVKTRKPPGNKGRTLLNTSGIGILKLDVKNNKIETGVLSGEGQYYHIK